MASKQPRPVSMLKMDFLSLTSLFHRNRHLVYLTDRLVFCTLQGDEPKFVTEGVKIQTALYENHHSESIAVFNVSSSSSCLKSHHTIIDINYKESTRNLDSILAICRSVQSWLNVSVHGKTASNVAVLFCNHPQMPIIVTCVLLTCEPLMSLNKVNAWFERLAKPPFSQTSVDTKRIILPSELRFLREFAQLQASSVAPLILRQTVTVNSITLITIPRCTHESASNSRVNGSQRQFACHLFFMILCQNEVVYNSLIAEKGVRVVASALPSTSFNLKEVSLSGDFSIVFYHRRDQGAPSRLCEVHSNSAFLNPSHSVYTVLRSELDDACVDPRFDSRFEIQIAYDVVKPHQDPMKIEESQQQIIANSVTLEPPTEDELLARSLQDELNLQSNDSETNFNLRPYSLSMQTSVTASGVLDEQARLVAADEELARMMQQMYDNEQVDGFGDMLREISADDLASVGLSLLPISRYVPPATALRQNSPANQSSINDQCQICRCDFQNQEFVRRLPCFHVFHPDCIDPWLIQKDACPICLTNVSDNLE